MARPRRVLVVDDEQTNRAMLEGMLEAFHHEAVLACDGEEALGKLDHNIDLVLLDVMMPGLNGYQVAQRIRADPDLCDIPIIMVTALTGKDDRLRAVEAGANDFIAKPVEMTELQVRTDSLLKMKAAQDEIKRHRLDLEQRVDERTQELQNAFDEIADAQRNTIEAHLDTIRRLVLAAEYKDEDTAAHIQRMSLYSVLLAERLGLPTDEVELLRHASPMHDVGKIGVPDYILLKPGRLTDGEMTIMRQHTLMGVRILQGSPSMLLQAGEVIALTHHEKWDGSGYPNGIAGEDIPRWGRICAVADVFDALTSDRVYRKAMPKEKALAIMRDGRGSHFEPMLVDLFFSQLDDMVEIQQTYQDGWNELHKL